MRCFLWLLLPILLVSCSKTVIEEDTVEYLKLTIPTQGSSAQVEENTAPSTPILINLIDQANNTVTIKEEPARVLIVGVDSFEAVFTQFVYSDVNYAVIPIDYDYNKIIALEPNLIICNTESNNYNSLRRSSIPTIGVNSITDYPENVVSTYNYWVKLLGEIFSKQEKATSILKNANRVFDLVKERTKTIDEPLTGVIVYSDDSTLEVGEGYGQFLFDHSNVKNIALGFDSHERDKDEIVALNSDVIYCSQVGEYIQNFDILSLDTPTALLWFSSVAYPDLFDDIDVNTEIQTHQELY